MRIVFTTFLLHTLLLAGCGQKGPLYLPQDQGAAVITPSAQNEQSEEEKDKRKSAN